MTGRPAIKNSPPRKVGRLVQVKLESNLLISRTALMLESVSHGLASQSLTLSELNFHPTIYRPGGLHPSQDLAVLRRPSCADHVEDWRRPHRGQGPRIMS